MKTWNMRVCMCACVCKCTCMCMYGWICVCVWVYKSRKKSCWCCCSYSCCYCYYYYAERNVLCSRCSCALCFVYFQWSFNIRRARFSICVCDSIYISLYLYTQKKICTRNRLFFLSFSVWKILRDTRKKYINSYLQIERRKRTRKKQKPDTTKNKVAYKSVSILMVLIWFLLVFLLSFAIRRHNLPFLFSPHKNYIVHWMLFYST